MKYSGTLISVNDIKKAKHFYESVMEQKVLMDLGVHISFDGGVSLQSNYSELVGKDLKMHSKPNNFQLYFEVENLDYWQNKIENLEDIEFLHKAKEYPWGQRVMRFYDYDNYIIEVAESMESVAKRFLSQGLSVEETAKRTMFPIEFLKRLKE
jgi:predicted enzyme related to lactoylglutathione lyase